MHSDIKMAANGSGRKVTDDVVVAATQEQNGPPHALGKEIGWIRLLTYLRWYPKDMPSQEKSLILKLDLSILIFGCLSFFTKYLDQASLTNAYVRFVTPGSVHAGLSLTHRHQWHEGGPWFHRE
jgi:ACS family pantothenate transporter-like MFS transporter